MPSPNARAVALLSLILTATACTEPTSGPSADRDAPSDATITCRADGSVGFSSNAVEVQRDGVHVRVVNERDEALDVEGVELGIEPMKRRDFVIGIGPGVVEVACVPLPADEGSQPTTSFEVLDPEGIWISDRLACGDGASFHEVVDFAGGSGVELEGGLPPLDEARGLIEGLLPEDELAIAGYPAARGPVIVIRDGRVIATAGFLEVGRGSGEWVRASGGGCVEAGLFSEAS